MTGIIERRWISHGRREDFDERVKGAHDVMRCDSAYGWNRNRGEDELEEDRDCVERTLRFQGSRSRITYRTGSIMRSCPYER